MDIRLEAAGFRLAVVAYSLFVNLIQLTRCY